VAPLTTMSTQAIIWRASEVCVVLLVAALLALVPAAYADPPDPTWIGGYWDDGDFDNVVIFIVKRAPSKYHRSPISDPCGRLSLASNRCRRGSSRSRLTPLLPPARRQYRVPAES